MILLGVRSSNSVRFKLEPSSSSAPGLDSVLLCTLVAQLLHEEQLQLDADDDDEELIHDSISSFIHGVHGGPWRTTTVSGVGVDCLGGGVKGGFISSTGSSCTGVVDAQTDTSCIMLNKYSSMGSERSNMERVCMARLIICPCATMYSCS